MPRWIPLLESVNLSTDGAEPSPDAVEAVCNRVLQARSTRSTVTHNYVTSPERKDPTAFGVHPCQGIAPMLLY